MAIQWYPGHMAKAKREFQEKLKLVDIVFELVDARVPYSSRNPDLNQLIGEKPRLVILMKSDLADPKQTKKWIDYYKERRIETVSINAKQAQKMESILKKTKQVLQPLFDKRKEKGLKQRVIRAVSVGIPNVGKSTIINRFAGKNIAQTGNKPGVTKAQQWIKYKNELEMLDTPGILWPKFEDQDVGKKLALTGAIKDTILHLDDVALYGIGYLRDHYPGAIAKRYKIDQTFEKESESPDLLLEITSKRGFKTDYERGAELFIHELRKGKLGRFTFEVPGENDNEKTNDQRN